MVHSSRFEHSLRCSVKTTAGGPYMAFRVHLLLARARGTGHAGLPAPPWLLSNAVHVVWQACMWGRCTAAAAGLVQPRPG